MPRWKSTGGKPTFSGLANRGKPLRRRKVATIHFWSHPMMLPSELPPPTLQETRNDNCTRKAEGHRDTIAELRRETSVPPLREAADGLTFSAQRQGLAWERCCCRWSLRRRKHVYSCSTTTPSSTMQLMTNAPTQLRHFTVVAGVCARHRPPAPPDGPPAPPVRHKEGGVHAATRPNQSEAQG